MLNWASSLNLYKLNHKKILRVYTGDFLLMDIITDKYCIPQFF